MADAPTNYPELVELMARGLCNADIVMGGGYRWETMSSGMKKHVRKCICSTLAAMHGAGVVPVPVEATEGMEEAAWDSDWEAMLAANPLRKE
jgi:hypothetical protein